MNAPKRLKIRQPLSAPEDFDLSEIIPVFHRWIQERSIPGGLIDVANYKHVPNGPGILLIGDEGDYSLEKVGGQLFFVYDRKRQTGDTLDESIAILLTTAQIALQMLAAESALGISPQHGGAEITLLDRLHYPNDQSTFDAINHSTAQAVAAATGQPHIHLTRSATDPRHPITLHIQSEQEIATA